MTTSARCDCGDTACPWCGTAQGTYSAPEAPDGPDVDAPEGDELDAEYDAHEDAIAPLDFADPGGTSALRAATPSNPRNLPCPNCGQPDKLTPADVRAGYQCDDCANAAERGY
jgi:hypothetical protein